ncbi:MAG: PilZ domain-containing protein [Planctomycetota bacterium]|nr:PilZ domain-containing protein [Planctomycetota bacterium]MDA1177189.1 PilZ domain-containing protein [Planctomycetota bacterium]
MHQSILDDTDRRQAARIPGSYASRQHVLLRVGRQDLAADLIDQSATGFSISLPRFGTRLKIGQRLLVGTRGTWHEVRVVHLEKSKKIVHAGLEILDDCVSPQDSAGFWTWVGLVATLVLASLIIYQTEDPDVGNLHRFLSVLSSNLRG